VCDPGSAIVCKRKEICPRDRTGIENVLACFKVPPEVAVTQRSGCKKKGQGKNVHFEDVAEGLVHELFEKEGVVSPEMRELGLDVLLAKEVSYKPSNPLHRSRYTSFGG
jgi:hypothetical protein